MYHITETNLHTMTTIMQNMRNAAPGRQAPPKFGPSRTRRYHRQFRQCIAPTNVTSPLRTPQFHSKHQHGNISGPSELSRPPRCSSAVFHALLLPHQPSVWWSAGEHSSPSRKSLRGHGNPLTRESWSGPSEPPPPSWSAPASILPSLQSTHPHPAYPPPPLTRSPPCRKPLPPLPHSTTSTSPKGQKWSPLQDTPCR